jgi:PhnB protein
MTTEVKPIPDGYHSVTPYLAIKGAAAAIDFYKKAFGAKEIMRIPQPDGRIGHAEIQIGDSRIMMADESPERSFLSPQSRGGSSVSLRIYTQDCDAMVARALSAGATLTRPLQDQFYGDRSGGVTDPFGHVWHVATHKEDVSPEEMDKRAKAAAKG